MDWKLLDYAKEAQDTAAGLHVFLEEIPQYSKDITGDIAELFAISNALHTLDEGLSLSRYGRSARRILRDLEVVIPSLAHTLDDVRHMFSRSNRNSKQHPGAFPGTPQYDLIYQDALSDMKAQGMILPVRLELYRSFLQGMYDILKGASSDVEHDQDRARLSKLLKKQEPVPTIDSYFSRLNMGDPRPYSPHTPAPPPPTAPRPSAGSRFQTYPNYAQPPPPPPPPPLPPRSPVYGDIPHVPHDPYAPHDVYIPHDPHRPHYASYSHLPLPPPPAPIMVSPSPVYPGTGYVPPPVPDIPQSPTYSSASSQAQSSHSSDSNSGAHWPTKIFDGRHSSTPFKKLGPPTRCLGRDEPQSLDFLEKDGFQKVLELPFEATDVWVRLYWRSDDNRARILFLTLDSTGRRLRYCFPLTGLKILRIESCLQLCRVNRQDGQLDLWANLRFPLYERMVLFYCTLVAMKRQDETPTPQGLEDFFQPGEKEEFGGEIQDAHYLHAFRIFRDRDSGCVRFEATARRGAHKNIPIWTAFVTQFIGARSWMKRISHNTVQFGKLHPYIFHQGYHLPKSASGKYQLTFSKPEDAKNLMEIFHHIKVR